MSQAAFHTPDADASTASLWHLVADLLHATIFNVLASNTDLIELHF